MNFYRRNEIRRSRVSTRNNTTIHSRGEHATHTLTQRRGIFSFFFFVFSIAGLSIFRRRGKREKNTPRNALDNCRGSDGVPRAKMECTSSKVAFRFTLFHDDEGRERKRGRNNWNARNSIARTTGKLFPPETRRKGLSPVILLLMSHRNYLILRLIHFTGFAIGSIVCLDSFPSVCVVSPCVHIYNNAQCL